MLKISGPISVAVMKVNNKYIYLFGCKHTDNKGLCVKCVEAKNCVFITDFIENLEHSDVFIESAWVAEESKKNVEIASPTSVLHTIRARYHDNLYTHKIHPTIRFHYADVRFTSPLYSLVKIVFDLLSHDNTFDVALTSQFLDPKKIKGLADIIVKSDNYQQSIFNEFETETAKKLIDTSFLPDKKQNGTHKIRKQILKLPKTKQQVLLKYHKDRIEHILVLYKQEIKKQPVNNVFIVIFDGILPMISHLMDLYLLARVQFYMKKKDSQNIVTYTGQQHTSNYITFFTKYLKGTKFLHHDDNEKSKRIKRCVSIPKVYAKASITS